MAEDTGNRVLSLLEEWERRKAAGESVDFDRLAAGDAELAGALRSAVQALDALKPLMTETLDTSRSARQDTAGPDFSIASSDREANRRPSTAQRPLACEEVVARLDSAKLDVAAGAARRLSADDGIVDGHEALSKLVADGTLTLFQAKRVAADAAESLSIGAYVLLDKLGEGGMGQVFLARHRAMDRTVAVKILPPHAVGSPEAIARFRREIQAAAKLSHPNIVCAYDAGEDRGRHFLAMECVEGEDLAARVNREGPFGLEEALDLTRRAAAGLEYAHSRKMVHRDIKPGNLLLSQAGELKILDFGLARIAEAAGAEGGDLTGTNVLMGTVDFMAPEQGTDARSAGAPADIYALGCTLHYLLTGKAPYGGDSLLNRLLAHRDAPIPSARATIPSVPASVDRLLARALAKRPEDRFPSMKAMREALEEELRKIREAAAPASARSSSGGGRRIGLLVGAASLFVLFAALAVMLIKVRTPHGTIVLEVSEPGAEVEVIDGDRVEVRRKSDGQKIEIAVDPGRKRLKVSKDGFELFVEEFELADGDERTLLARLEPTAEAAEPPNAGVHPSPPASLPPVPSLSNRTPSPSETLSPGGFSWEPGPAEDVLPGLTPRPAVLPGVERWQVRVSNEGLGAAWHPDGKKIAYGDANGIVTIVDVLTGRRIRAFHANDGAVRHLAWNATGDAMATGRDQSVTIWSADGELKQELTGHTANVYCIAWSPDGSRLASGGHYGDATVRIWSADGTPGPVIPHKDYVDAIAWSPDGKTLASVDVGFRAIVLSDPDDGSELGRLGPIGHTSALAWSPDGKYLASGGGDWDKAKVGGYIWDVETREPVVELKKENTWINWLGWSSDGKLAATTQDNYLFLYDTTTGEQLPHPWVQLHPNPGHSSWSPDGDRLADATGRIWTVGDDGRSIELDGDASPRTLRFDSVSFRPDGRRFVTSTFEGILQIWNVDGAPAATLPVQNGHVRNVAWNPRQDLIAVGSWIDRDVRIYRPDGTLERTLTGHANRVLRTAWTSDGERLATASHDGTARIWNADGSPGPVLEGHDGGVYWVDWHPDGTRLATGGADGTVRVWGSDGALQETLRGHDGESHCVAWSPDGRILASAGLHDGNVNLWDATTFEHEAIVVAPGDRLLDLRWKPDGSALAAAAERSGDVSLLTPQGDKIVTLPGSPNFGGLNWSPSGDRLATVARDGTILLRDGDGVPERVVLARTDGVFLSFDAGGRRLNEATANDAWFVYLIELESGERVSLSPAEFDAFVASGRRFDERHVDRSASETSETSSAEE